MSDERTYDIAVIGGGPGGYVAAIKAAQMGMKVALIDKGKLGGTCLNVGCIPTKTLLASAEMLRSLQHAGDLGISIGSLSFDYKKMKERKDHVIGRLGKGIEGLLLSNQVSFIQGKASFLSPRKIAVEGKTPCILDVGKSIIAMGSEPLEIPALPCDHQMVYNSSSILEMVELPKTLAIIGGGYIGCEFASLYSQLGVKVTLIEALPTLLPLQGKGVAEAVMASFKKQGIEIRNNVIVESIEKRSGELLIHIQGSPPLLCDKALIAIGRKGVSQGAGLEKAGIALDGKGFISVNDKMETNVPGIYAIGDITGKFLLAHVASHQGIVAATNAAGGKAEINYRAVPAVIFTFPEIATVGMTLEEALANHFEATVGKFPFQALGKAIASSEVEGFAQVVIDKKQGKILGAQVVGHGAGTLIAEIAIALENGIPLAGLIETIHAHPTLPEAWLEAALIANETPIHFPPKPKK